MCVHDDGTVDVGAAPRGRSRFGAEGTGPGIEGRVPGDLALVAAKVEAERATRGSMLAAKNIWGTPTMTCNEIGPRHREQGWARFRPGRVADIEVSRPAIMLL